MNKDFFVEDSKGLIPSLSTVLLQEMTKFNRLLDVLRTSLDNLNDSILGLMTMSQELDAMYSSLLNNQVKIKQNDILGTYCFVIGTKAVVR